MPDLLSHAFIAYSIGLVLSWRYDWLDARYVTIVMAGAFIPDIAKIVLVLPSEYVAALLGVPFDWLGIHTLGGAVCCGLVGVVLVDPAERRRVGTLLSIGAGSHLFADALLLNAAGYSYPLLYPLTSYAPPTPGVYLSSDIWPSLLTGAVALGLWVFSRRRTLPKTA